MPIDRDALCRFLSANPWLALTEPPCTDQEPLDLLVITSDNTIEDKYAEDIDSETVLYTLTVEGGSGTYVYDTSGGSEELEISPDGAVTFIGAPKKGKYTFTVEVTDRQDPRVRSVTLEPIMFYVFPPLELQLTNDEPCFAHNVDVQETVIGEVLASGGNGEFEEKPTYTFTMTTTAPIRLAAAAVEDDSGFFNCCGIIFHESIYAKDPPISPGKYEYTVTVSDGIKTTSIAGSFEVVPQLVVGVEPYDSHFAVSCSQLPFQRNFSIEGGCPPFEVTFSESSRTGSDGYYNLNGEAVEGGRGGSIESIDRSFDLTTINTGAYPYDAEITIIVSDQLGQSWQRSYDDLVYDDTSPFADWSWAGDNNVFVIEDKLPISIGTVTAVDGCDLSDIFFSFPSLPYGFTESERGAATVVLVEAVEPGDYTLAISVSDLSGNEVRLERIVTIRNEKYTIVRPQAVIERIRTPDYDAGLAPRLRGIWHSILRTLQSTNGNIQVVLSGLRDMQDQVGPITASTMHVIAYAEGVRLGSLPSLADYTLTVKEFDHGSEAKETYGTSYRVYVDMMNANDHLIAVSGDRDRPFIVKARAGLYNSELKKNFDHRLLVRAEELTNLPGDIGMRASANSYFTIRGKEGGGPVSLVEDGTQPISVPFQTNGVTEIRSDTLTGASWYVINVNPRGLPNDNLEVMIMQLTTKGDITGNINAQVYPLGVGADQVQLTFPLNNDSSKPLTDQNIDATDNAESPYKLIVRKKDHGVTATVGTSYQFFIKMSDPTDRLSAVFGNNITPLVIEVPSGLYIFPGSKWNAIDVGFDYTGNESSIPLEIFSQLAADSWIDMLGKESGGDIVEVIGEAISLFDTASPDVPFEGRFDSVSGGAWYLPFNMTLAALPDSNSQVAIMQLTTKGEVSGQVYLQIFGNGNPNNDIRKRIKFDSTKGITASDGTAAPWSFVSAYTTNIVISVGPSLFPPMSGIIIDEASISASIPSDTLRTSHLPDTSAEPYNGYIGPRVYDEAALIEYLQFFIADGNPGLNYKQHGQVSSAAEYSTKTLGGIQHLAYEGNIVGKLSQYKLYIPIYETLIADRDLTLGDIEYLKMISKNGTSNRAKNDVFLNIYFVQEGDDRIRPRLDYYFGDSEPFTALTLALEKPNVAVKGDESEVYGEDAWKEADETLRTRKIQSMYISTTSNQQKQLDVTIVSSELKLTDSVVPCIIRFSGEPALTIASDSTVTVEEDSSIGTTIYRTETVGPADISDIDFSIEGGDTFIIDSETGIVTLNSDLVEGRVYGFVVTATATISGDTASKRVTVHAVPAPLRITAPADYMVECGEEFPRDPPTVTGGVGVINIQEEQYSEGDNRYSYTIIRLFTATDEDDNTVSAEQTIIVQDTTAPEFDNFEDEITISYEDDVAGGPPYGVATDSCSVPFVYYTDSYPVSSTNEDADYMYTRTYTAEDDAGNSTTQSQTIHVRYTTELNSRSYERLSNADQATRDKITKIGRFSVTRPTENIRALVVISGEKYPNITTIADAAFSEHELSERAPITVTISGIFSELQTIGVAAFTDYKGKLTISGEFPKLHTIGQSAFHSVSNAESSIEFKGLPELQTIEGTAFHHYEGKLTISGEFPNLRTIELSAFNSAEGSIEFREGLPELHTVAARAFDNFKGTLTLSGAFPKLSRVRENSGWPYTLTIEKYASSGLARPDGTLIGTTYRIYMNMVNANDYLSTVSGDANYPLVINAPAGIYNNTVNSTWNTSGISSFFFPFTPQLEYDSFATIGYTGPSGNLPNLVEGNPKHSVSDFFMVDGATTLEVADSVGSAWYIPFSRPDNNQGGWADDNNRVLITQLTTTGTLNGAFQIQIFQAGDQGKGVRAYWRFDIGDDYGSEFVTASFAASSVREGYPIIKGY